MLYVAGSVRCNHADHFRANQFRNVMYGFASDAVNIPDANPIDYLRIDVFDQCANDSG